MPTITELLRPAEYACGYIGKWHLGNETRRQRGFDHWVNTEDSYVRNHELEGYSSNYHFLVSQGYTPLDLHANSTIFDRHTAVRTIRGGQWKLNVSSSGEHELYDVKSDVGELHDSFRDPGSHDTVLELYRKLLSWQRDTNDKMALPRLYDE